MINISIDCDPKFISPNHDIVKQTASLVFKKNQILDGNVSFIFGSDNLVSELKKQFFQKDQWTYVIAFRLNEYDEKDVEGEIYISLPRAKENAVSYQEVFEKEVVRLIIHGSLHLLGFNDESDNEKKVMTKMENNFINQISWQTLFEI